MKFDLRICPALLHKPSLPTPHFPIDGPGNSTNDAKTNPEDPFAPPYPTGLCVGRMNGEDDSQYIIMVRLGGGLVCEEL